MGPAAEESAKAASAATATSDTDVPSTALTEDFRSQTEENMSAHRRMRWWAFGVVGSVCGIYLLALLCVLWRFFDGHLIAAMLGANDTLNWHVLVLIGMALVIFAAVPLTLVMALVRMISEQVREPDTIKMPTTELAKLFFETAKSMFSATGRG
jgi:hypothetical protein